MDVVVVDYGIGNLGSIPNMLRRLGTVARITSDRGAIRAAERVILPGVGAFDAGITRLRELDLEDVLEEKHADGETPILGLCLGMELLFERSAEGEEPGLGWIRGEIVAFDPSRNGTPLPIPHMGWNVVHAVRDHPILAGLGDEPRFYFAHSFHARCESDEDVVATTDYGGPFPAVVAKGNLIGAQFHPEKSHRFGLQLLRNFLELDSPG